jgi:hypothetical protein
VKNTFIGVMEVQPDSISGAVPEIRFLVQLWGDHNAGKGGDPDTAHIMSRSPIHC